MVSTNVVALYCPWSIIPGPTLLGSTKHSMNQGRRQGRKEGNWGIFSSRPNLVRDLKWGPQLHCQKRLKYSNRKVTPTQQSAKAIQ